MIKHRDLVFEQLSEGEWVIFDNRNDNVHLLNSTSATFYQLCNDITLDSALDRYVLAYKESNIEENTLRHDAYKIYNALKDIDVIYEEM